MCFVIIKIWHLKLRSVWQMFVWDECVHSVSQSLANVSISFLSLLLMINVIIYIANFYTNCSWPYNRIAGKMEYWRVLEYWKMFESASYEKILKWMIRWINAMKTFAHVSPVHAIPRIFRWVFRHRGTSPDQVGKPAAKQKKHTHKSRIAAQKNNCLK